MDEVIYIYMEYTDGTRIMKGLFGKEHIVLNTNKLDLKARICPNCGKVELYVDKIHNQ